MSGFSFSFSGDDIEDVPITNSEEKLISTPKHAAETGTLRRPSSSAFPIAGKTLLEPRSHDLIAMLKTLPSKIAYSTLEVTLDSKEKVSIPRRELWDVRVQLMAEEDDEGLGNLAQDDVRTGVYEGGFKSWESSVDLVKLLDLQSRKESMLEDRCKVLELGCGTALPSLSVFQWFCQTSEAPTNGLSLGLADYNPTVLQLVTLPNIVLSWAQFTRMSLWEAEGELEIDEKLIEDFLSYLKFFKITISFFSGAWGSEFVRLVRDTMRLDTHQLVIIGAETIYSPFALASFADTLIDFMKTMPDEEILALVAAKTVYFGVGGSMEDFCIRLRAKGASVEQVREESAGVKREVVEVKLPVSHR